MRPVSSQTSYKVFMSSRTGLRVLKRSAFFGYLMSTLPILVDFIRAPVNKEPTVTFSMSFGLSCDDFMFKIVLR